MFGVIVGVAVTLGVVVKVALADKEGEVETAGVGETESEIVEVIDGEGQGVAKPVESTHKMS